MVHRGLRPEQLLAQGGNASWPGGVLRGKEYVGDGSCERGVEEW